MSFLLGICVIFLTPLTQTVLRDLQWIHMRFDEGMLDTTTYDELRTVVPSNKFNMNHPPLGHLQHLGRHRDQNFETRFIVWNATQNMATPRSIEVRPAGVDNMGSRRRMSRTTVGLVAGPRATVVPASQPRRPDAVLVGPKTNTKELATEFPRFSA